MKLNERYYVRDRKDAKQWLLVVAACFLLGVFLCLTPTLARYVTDFNGKLDADVAQWNMKINGVDVSRSDATTLTMDMIPTKNQIPDAPKKLKPGQEGYFDFIVNPEGTEVSFSYQISLDWDYGRVPSGMTFTKYTMNGTEVSLAEKKSLLLTGDKFLPASGVFGASDGINVRVFWKWANDASDDGSSGTADYEIAIEVTINQYCDPTAEGAKA